MLFSTDTIAFVTFMVSWLLLKPKPIKGKRAFPARNPLPLVGNVMDLDENSILDFLIKNWNSAGRADFEAFILGKRTLFVSDWNVLKYVMNKRPKVFRRDRNYEGFAIDSDLMTSLFMAEGDVWMRVRRLTSSSFSRPNVILMSTRIFEECNRLIESYRSCAANGEVVDGFVTLMSYTQAALCSVAFGSAINSIPYLKSAQFLEDIVILFQWSNRRAVIPLPRLFWHYIWNDNIEKMNYQADSRMQAAISTLVRCEIESPSAESHAFLSSLLAAHSKENGTRDSLQVHEVVAQIKVFMLDGIETTASLIASTLYQLCLPENSKWNDILFKEIRDAFGSNSTMTNVDQIDKIPLTEAFIKETNRLIGPSPFESFQTTSLDHEEELPGGYVIQPHEMITLNFMCCMRDNTVFDDADRFDPLRWLPQTHASNPQKLVEMNERYLGFGGGPRVCPGVRLAEIEAICAIANIVSNFTFALDCPVEEITRYYTFTSKPSKLPLQFQVRNF